MENLSSGVVVVKSAKDGVRLRYRWRATMKRFFSWQLFSEVSRHTRSNPMPPTGQAVSGVAMSIINEARNILATAPPDYGSLAFYLQLASAAKASKHSTAVAEKISGKCSMSMKAPFQVILLKAILHRSKKPDVAAVTLFFWRLPVSGPGCVCDGAHDRAPADAVNSQSRFSCRSRS